MNPKIEKAKLEYKGKVFHVLDGDLKILEYNSARDVLIEFLDTGYQTHAAITDIRHGCNIKDRLKPSVLGVGLVGDGNYALQINKVRTKYGSVWKKMLDRCYNPKHMSYKSYGAIGVHVCNEWLNLQNFAKWFEDNYIEGWQLDKDIMIKNNKIYSPDTCCFLPEEINKCFEKRASCRGDYPLGVIFDKRTKKYRASLENKYLGQYETVEEAFLKYKTEKEAKIKSLVEKYSELLPDRTKQALLSYIVEITD